MGRLKICSPLHIGTGKELQRNVDYLWSRDTCYVFDEDAFEQLFVNLPPDVQTAFYDGENLESLLKKHFGNQYSQRLPGLATYSTPLYPKSPWVSPWQIKPFVRNGYGEPFVPGTSIKGAIRNAVCWCYLKDLRSRYHQEYDRLVALIDRILRDGSNREISHVGDKLRDVFDHDVFQPFRLQEQRGDPHTDIFRCLSVEDTEPLSENNLKLAVVRSLSLDRNGWCYSTGQRYPDTGRRKGNPFSNYVESLPATVPLLRCSLAADAERLGDFKPERENVSLKDFLIRECIRRYSGVDDQKLLLTILDLCQTFTDYAVRRELRFLLRLSGVSDVVDFYTTECYLNPKAVTPDLLPLPDKPDRPNLRVGWGSGLEEASILDALPRTTRDSVKPLFLDRVWRNWPTKWWWFRIFPKTRRFIVKYNQRSIQPVRPLGWVRIDG